MKEPVRCPLTRYQGLLWSIAAHVGGAQRTLLVDLGAGVTCLSIDLVETLQLPFERRCSGRRMSGEEVEFTLHAGAELGFGDVSLDLPRVGALDLSRLLPPDWPPVDGVLALDALAERPFTLDLAADELIFETPESLRVRTDAGCPLTARRHVQIEDVSLVLLVAVRSPVGVLWFELDNSNTGPVVVTPHSAEALGIAPEGEHAFEIDGLGRVTSPVVVREILYDGNLGRSVLDGRSPTFDIANDVVVAAPP